MHRLRSSHIKLFYSTGAECNWQRWLLQVLWSLQHVLKVNNLSLLFDALLVWWTQLCFTFFCSWSSARAAEECWHLELREQCEHKLLPPTLRCCEGEMEEMNEMGCVQGWRALCMVLTVERDQAREQCQLVQEREAELIKQLERLRRTHSESMHHIGWLL